MPRKLPRSEASSCGITNKLGNFYGIQFEMNFEIQLFLGFGDFPLLLNGKYFLYKRSINKIKLDVQDNTA